MRTVWGVGLPILLVRLYRLQPAAFRGWAWGLFGFTRPTSHLAIPAIRAAGPSGGWAAFWAAFWASPDSWE